MEVSLQGDSSHSERLGAILESFLKNDGISRAKKQIEERSMLIYMINKFGYLAGGSAGL